MSNKPEISRWSEVPEGQFFERKSAFDRSGRRPRQRKPADVARDIAETLAAMANADGGELVVGLEDGGEYTGVPFAGDRVKLLLGVPRDRNYVDPLLPCQAREVAGPDGKRLLHYMVDWSPEVHRLADGRYLLRVGDSTKPFPAAQIQALKETKAQGLLERSFPPGATRDDLDWDLATRVLNLRKGGVTRTDPEEFLRRNRLLEGRNGRAVPCLAALLLFGKEPGRWHPRCGIDFVRWEGTERKHGAELNIAKRVRMEEPLAVLIEKAHESIRPFIRERQQLHDLFFTERLEYPTFVWQEAIVNAVAHRDYSVQGASIEVWMFDDRIEVRSPGLPPHPVTVDSLSRREHIHVSRNPLLVRVLVELGYMRELGEGIPRMFEEMERQGFYPPRLEVTGGAFFQVTLRNQPVYDDATLKWLDRFADAGLSGDQKRLLAFAHAHDDRFTSKEFQQLAGLDIYGASAAIKDLVRKGVARSTGSGSRIYEVTEPLRPTSDMPEALVKLLPILQKKQEIANEDVRKHLKVSRTHATRIANELCESGWLEPSGTKRWRRYRFAGGGRRPPEGGDS